MKHVILTGLALLLSLYLNAQSTAKGTVFEDTNHNGKQDRKEKGITNVAITNGTEVVLTNSKGKYEIPVSEDATISVIKPAGHQVPVNENKIPQFYYIHKPNGSPASKFKGIAPSGKLPKKIDFALFPAEEDENFTALIFGDPQPYTKEEVDFFAKGIVSEVEGIKNVSFGLSLGDLVGNDLSLFNPYIQATKKAGIPWYNLLGNHDLNFDAAEDHLADETYEAHFGPANYAFNVGKVHFIILDDVLYPDPRDHKGYWGGFREDQLNFIKNDLKFVPKENLIVLAFHIPLSEPWNDAFRDEDRDRLFQLLKDYPNTLSLSAHTHIQKQDFFTKEEGWLQEKPHHHYNVGTTSGDWYSGKLNEQGIPISTMRDGTPKGYAFIHFNGNNYSINYKVAGKPKDYQMHIFNPKVVAKGRKSRSGIYVNFFMGSKDDKVEYKIDQEDWKPMQYIEAQDPTYESLLYEWDKSDQLFTGRRGNNAIDSKHLWQGKIPTKLETGKHQIQVKATDMFGNTYYAESTYRIENPL